MGSEELYWYKYIIFIDVADKVFKTIKEWKIWLKLKEKGQEQKQLCYVSLI